MLLDGHLRFEALKILGREEVNCILSTDDESYTYNKRVNHIPPVAQHFMLMEALKSGVAEERIAATLNVDVAAIRRRAQMLEGICPRGCGDVARQEAKPGTVPDTAKDESDWTDRNGGANGPPQ